MGAIEQKCRADLRMTRKEACAFVAKSLRLTLDYVSKTKIAELGDYRTGENGKFFDRAKVIAYVNRKLG